MLYKYGKRKRDFLGRFIFYLVLFYYGALVGYEMIIATSALRTSLAYLSSHIQGPLVE